MIPKKHTLGATWDVKDNNVDPERLAVLDMMLNDLFVGAVQMRVSTYTGSGNAKTIDTGFSPQLVVIMKLIDAARTTSYPVSGNGCLASKANPSISLLFGGTGEGFTNQGVTAWAGTTITVGTSAHVNASGSTYILIALG